ncbi:MAG: multidrug transporter [Rhodobacteraceae bacterium]|nr:multidrug transporter [Paracoccaceae bacterium]
MAEPPNPTPNPSLAPAPAPRPGLGEEGRFTRGSTMRHVTVMTLTGSLGLTFMFLVDFVTLLYVSMLGDERLTSAVGYAWTIQFFTVAMGMGFGVAATALVSRALGARDKARARRIAGSVMTSAFVFLLVMAFVLTAMRDWVLHLLGAEGFVHAQASDFLLVTMPTLPFMASGMLGSSVLRAMGDARRAMMVTLSAGIVVALAAPFLIFEDVFGIPALGLGIFGAAGGLALTRVWTAGMGFYYAVIHHDLVQRPRLATVLADLPAIVRIATPSALTQLSTPVANFLLTAAISGYGAGYVAGWAVGSRMTVLAFAGVFSLSSAIGGIVGQNYGAGRFDRVRMTYRDALIFCAGYVAVVWAIMAAASDALADGFSLSEEGSEVVHAFGEIGAGGFLFAGAAFVAVAAFNSLGRPVWSTCVNWARDAGAIPLMLVVFGALPFGATGVIYAQAAGGALVGVAAGLIGWRYVRRLERRAEADAPAGTEAGTEAGLGRPAAE